MRSFTDIIYSSFLPQALSLGVPYETFWDLNPRTLQPFVDAFKMRAKREMDAERTKMDLLAWQIGLYTRHAVGSLFDSKSKYPSEPLTFTADRERNMTGADHAARFAAWAAQHSAHRKPTHSSTHTHNSTHRSRGEGCHESK